MPVFDDERRARWRMEAESDGWKWWDPHWDQRVAMGSTLALAVEALRRAVDLRDACAESGEDNGLTSRALFLVDVLNPLLEHEVQQRAEVLRPFIADPRETLTEHVQHLLVAGVLTPEEYRADSN
jgi:hypothetical protein